MITEKLRQRFVVRETEGKGYAGKSGGYETEVENAKQFSSCEAASYVMTVLDSVGSSLHEVRRVEYQNIMVLVEVKDETEVT